MKLRAKEFAIMAHESQTRKNSNTPYITHPIRVAERLERNESTDELVCAAYLYDVVEDTSYDIKEIETLFGSRVAQLVAAHTEDKTKSWQDRKQQTINDIKHAEKEVKYLIVADRLDNLLDLENSLKMHGNKIRGNFNAPYEKKVVYNEAIAKNMVIGLDEKDIPDFFLEFKSAIL